jgi:heme-degrading monooxygenase HmoA
MALGIMTWNLPAAGPSAEYAERARTSWIPTVLAQPGVKEFRGYRHPAGDHLKVLVETEFESSEQAQQWMKSADYARIKAELADLGATDIADETWDTSPLLPEPLHPKE